MPAVALTHTNLTAGFAAPTRTSAHAVSNQNHGGFTPTAASMKVETLLSQFLHTQEWSVVFPAPLTDKLLHYIPPCIENATSFPGTSQDKTTSSFSAHLVGDTEMLSHGMLEEIPLAHYLMFPEQDREYEESSKQVEQRNKEAVEAHLNTPFRNAKDRNPNLPAEDFALVDVDFATPHKSRQLPSLSFLVNPVYTEIGFRTAKQRHQDRLSALAGVNSAAVGGDSSDALSPATGGTPSATPEDRSTKWKNQLITTFKNAKAFDASFDGLLVEIAAKKLGILLRSETTGADVQAAVDCVRHLFTAMAFITSNGTSMGSTKNNTNVDRASYNTVQGRFVASALWSEVCKAAANSTKATATTAEALCAAFVTAAHMPSEGLDNLGLEMGDATDGFRGDCALRSALRREVLLWASTFVTLLTETAKRASTKKEPVTLEHTERDLTVLSIPKELASLERLTDEYVSIDGASNPLILSSNVPIPALYSQLTAANDRKTASGAVPVAVYPLFPEGFEQVARPEYTLSAEGSALSPVEAIQQARTFAFGTVDCDGKAIAGNLRRITLDGEKNGYAVAPYTPSSVRIPHILLHNPSGKSVDEIERDHKVFLQPTSYNADSNQNMTVAGVPFTAGSTTSYRSRPISSDYEEYYSDTNCTINYLMRLVPESEDRVANARDIHSLPAKVQAFVQRGGYATYQRVPTFSRYRRTASKVTNGQEKCVTVSWETTEEDASNEQLEIIGAKRQRSEDGHHTQ